MLFFCVQSTILLFYGDTRYRGDQIKLGEQIRFTAERKLPVDQGVPKRPIRFKLSVRTGNPLSWVSQNLPANEATSHPPTVECKQTKKSMGSRNEDSTLWSSCSRGNKFECDGQ